MKKSDWSFIHVSDMHIGSPRSYRFQPAWNENWEVARRQIVKLKPDFLLVGGDMTRDGSTHRYELEQAKNDFDALPFPWYAVPGNHEVGNKYRESDSMSIQQSFVELYASVFGPSHWSFEYRDIRISGFDALLLGSGLPQEEQLLSWLDEQRQNSASRFHIWILHPPLFADQPDEADFNPEVDRVAWYFTIDRTYRFLLHELFQETQATHVVSGHVHCRRQVTWDGIHYHFAPSTAFPQWSDRWSDGDPTLGFLHFEVFPDRILPQFIPLQRVSRAKGYGPGGNPPLEGRDYSVAWEK